MIPKPTRYYRYIAQSALQHYFEFEEGAVREGGFTEPIFDVRLLDYRIDLERVIRSMPPMDFQIMTAIHRDGLSHTDAAKLAGIETERPDLLVGQVERRFGRMLDKLRLGSLADYLSK